MNRRDLLKRLGAAGLVAATLDMPRFYSLDRTMIPDDGFRMWGDFDIRYTAQVTPPPVFMIQTAEISAEEWERRYQEKIVRTWEKELMEWVMEHPWVQGQV